MSFLILKITNMDQIIDKIFKQNKITNSFKYIII